MNSLFIDDKIIHKQQQQPKLYERKKKLCEKKSDKYTVTYANVNEKQCATIQIIASYSLQFASSIACTLSRSVEYIKHIVSDFIGRIAVLHT